MAAAYAAAGVPAPGMAGVGKQWREVNCNTEHLRSKFTIAYS